MSAPKRRYFVAPIVILIVVSLPVSLAVVSGITTYLSVYDETINALRQQNKALINRIDGWISLKGCIVEYNAKLLRNRRFSLDDALDHLADIARTNENVYDAHIDFPDGRTFSAMGNPVSQSRLLSTCPRYSAAVRSPGAVVYTLPYTDVLLRRKAFIGARTIGNDDAALGVIALEVPFSMMENFVAVNHGMNASVSFILDANGYILLHHDPAFAPVDFNVFQNKREVEGGRYARMVDSITDDGFHVGDGNVYIGAPLETTGWYVVTRVPTSYIMSKIFGSLLSIGATVLLAVITLIGTALFLLRIRESMKRERAAHEMNDIFFYSSPFIMNIWDDGYNLIATSQQSVEMFGLSDQKQYLERFRELSPEFQPCGTPSGEKALYYVREAFRTGRAKFEWMHQTLSGEPLPCEIILVRFTHKNRHMVAAYTIDLRPIKAAMEKEREAEERVKLVIDASPMACYLLDENRMVIDCNQTAIELFLKEPGKPLAETYPEQGWFERCELNCSGCRLRGRDACSSRRYLIRNTFYIFPEYRDNKEEIRRLTAEHCARALKDGLYRFELTFVTLYGETIPCEVTIVPIKHLGKTAFAVYLRDLREHNRMLSEMRRREAAEEESRAKTRFLARMSHEIRTPMNAVLGIAEIQLRQEEKHPPKTEEAFMHIYKSANLLLTIINDILDLSKVESGKMEIIPDTYEVANLIADTVQLNLIHLDRKKIEFSLIVDERLPVLLVGDELRIKQILNNLLSNAFKYTPEGTVTLSVCAEPAPEPDGVILVINIVDTGQGMTDEQIGRLFDIEYTRFNIKNNRAIEGSGLGMSITHSFITMMNGEIKVESAPGKGSGFTVRLPQKTKDDRILGGEVALKLQNLEIAQKFQQKAGKFTLDPMPYGRVLLVDDVEINLHVAEGILTSYEIVVETAGSGPEAVEKIKNGAVYDIIFMDHMMPGMDGIETARIMRDMGYANPIVALTANALKDMAEIFMNNGFSGFIPKPIDIEQLNVCLVRFIRDRHLASGD